MHRHMVSLGWPEVVSGCASCRAARASVRGPAARRPKFLAQQTSLECRGSSSRTSHSLPHIRQCLRHSGAWSAHKSFRSTVDTLALGRSLGEGKEASCRGDRPRWSGRAMGASCAGWAKRQHQPGALNRQWAMQEQFRTWQQQHCRCAHWQGRRTLCCAPLPRV